MLLTGLGTFKEVNPEEDPKMCKEEEISLNTNK